MKQTQVDRILAKFSVGGSSGAYKLAEALRKLAPDKHRDVSTIYRWNRAKPIGTGGLVPACAVDDVNAAAEIVGVKLTAADWDPRRA